jgi:hypothetical protein
MREEEREGGEERRDLSERRLALVSLSCRR